jgi:hypothetical protein
MMIHFYESIDGRIILTDSYPKKVRELTKVALGDGRKASVRKARHKLKKLEDDMEQAMSGLSRVMLELGITNPAELFYETEEEQKQRLARSQNVFPIKWPSARL